MTNEIYAMNLRTGNMRLPPHDLYSASRDLYTRVLLWFGTSQAPVYFGIMSLAL